MVPNTACKSVVFELVQVEPLSVEYSKTLIVLEVYDCPKSQTLLFQFMEFLNLPSDLLEDAAVYHWLPLGLDNIISSVPKNCPFANLIENPPEEPKLPPLIGVNQVVKLDTAVCAMSTVSVLDPYPTATCFKLNSIDDTL